MRAKLFPAFLILCGFAAAAQPLDIGHGLVSYWPLDATDGVTTPDASAFGNHLNLSNMDASNFVPGKYGNAARFDGVNEMLHSIYTVGAGNGLPIHGARHYTVMLWVNGVGATQGDRRVFSEGSMTATAPLFSIGTDNASVAAGRTNVVDIFLRNDANTALHNHRKSVGMGFDGTWHHIAWVEEDGIARLYIDGELDATVFNYSRTGTFTFNTIALGALQRATPASFFSGMIDDAAIWERPLSQAEIQEVMNNGLATPIGPYPPLLLSEPASGSRGPGDRIVFSTRAVGNRPLSYQWYKGETIIDGATAASYTVSAITAAEAGDYRVVVTNPSGSKTSEVATLTFVPDPASDVRAGLISYWPMDEVEIDALSPYKTDDVYSHNDFSLITAGFFEQPAGAFGTAVGFDGLDQYALRRSGFPIYSNPGLSVSLWVNAIGTGQTDRRFFAESSTNSTNPLFVFGTHSTGSNGTIRVFIRGDAGGAAQTLDRHSTRQPLDGTWHHVVWTEDNGQGKLYIDGVLDETDFTYPRFPTTLNQTALGTIVRSVAAPFFAGALDEVALWNRVLTFTEIQEIFTSGIPAPLGDIAPEITEHPASQSIYTRGKAAFRFVATGTAPLFAQWRKSEQNLSNQTNDTLVITNAVLGDAGDYDVVVSNAAGAVTSSVATLTVDLRPASPEFLKIDFNDTLENTAAQTETGFMPFALPAAGPGPVMQRFGGAEVTVAGAGVTLESRRRATPVNSGAFTEEQLLRDFIFARDALAGEGLDLTIEFMESSQLYAATVWSFDSGSASPARISDWFANGNLVVSGYNMINTELPTSNERWRMNFDVMSDADGKIVIQGRRNPSASAGINVFLNAVQLVKPGIRIHQFQVLDGFDMVMVVEVINPGVPHLVQEKTDLAQSTWTDTPNVVWTSLGGRMLQATFSVPIGTTFYTVAEGATP